MAADELASSREEIRRRIAEEVKAGSPDVGDGSAEQVTALRLLNLRDIASLEPLREYPNLASLRILRGTIQDLAPLAELHQLEHLELGVDVKVKKNLELIGQLRTLTSLTIAKGYEYLAGSESKLLSLCVKSTNIELDRIGGLVTLQNLTLGNGWASFSDLAPLRNLLGLEHLVLAPHKCVSLEPLTEMRKMRELSPGGGKAMRSLRGLEHMTELQTLDLRGTTVSSLAELAHKPKLAHLNLRGLPIEDMAPVADACELTVAYLEKTRLRSLEALANKQRLRLLWIWGTAVRDIAPLRGLTALEDLSLSSLDGLTDFEPLRSLKALRALDLYDTRFFDVELLLDLPNLEHVRLAHTRVQESDATLAPLARALRARGGGVSFSTAQNWQRA